MAGAPEQIAILEDLHRVEGKAELIGGRIVELIPSGDLPSRVAFEIAASLRNYARGRGAGSACPDGTGFAFKRSLSSGRQSFCPDASFHTGPPSRNLMGFVVGAPAFAVEVRRQNGYGPGAEMNQAAKREEYFEAGTEIVWDVDSRAKRIVAYRASLSQAISEFGPGQEAHAEPAVPGWRVAVDGLF
jgi:Uma2 family endonuclease